LYQTIELSQDSKCSNIYIYIYIKTNSKIEPQIHGKLLRGSIYERTKLINKAIVNDVTKGKLDTILNPVIQHVKIA